MGHQAGMHRIKSRCAVGKAAVWFALRDCLQECRDGLGLTAASETERDGAGETAQPLRVRPALPEDPDLLVSVHMRQITIARDSQSPYN